MIRHSVSWIVVIVVILSQQDHVNTFCSKGNDDKQLAEYACGYIGIHGRSSKHDVKKCIETMMNYIVKGNPDVVLKVAEELGKAYNKNTPSKEKYEEFGTVIDIFKDWGGEEVNKFLNGIIHLIHPGGVKNIARFIEFGDKLWWGKIFLTKTPKITDFNPSLIIDRVLSKDRFKTTFPHIMTWLNGNKNRKCDEFAIMEFLEYEAERTERLTTYAQFAEMFDEICREKKWTASHLSDILKHKPIHKLKIDLVRRILVGNNIVTALSRGSKFWSGSDMAVEMGRCKDNKCIDETGSIILAADAIKLPATAYRNVYTYLHRQHITGEQILKFIQGVNEEFSSDDTNDDIEEYLIRLYFLRSSGLQIADLKFLDDVKLWPLKEKKGFLQSLAKHDFAIEETTEFLKAVNCNGQSFQKNFIHALDYFGRWYMSDLTFNGIWKSIINNKVYNVCDIMKQLKPLEQSQNPTTEQTEIMVKIYFTHYNNIQPCSDTILGKLGQYLNVTGSTVSQEIGIQLIKDACSHKNGYNLVQSAVNNKISLEKLKSSLKPTSG